MQSEPVPVDGDQRPPSSPERFFATRVRERRDLLGWSQVQLALELKQAGHDLDATTITRLERGERRIRLDDAVALADVLGLDLWASIGPNPVDLREQIDRAEVEVEAAAQAERYWAAAREAASRRRLELREMLIEALEQGKHARGVDQEEA